MLRVKVKEEGKVISWGFCEVLLGAPLDLKEFLFLSLTLGSFRLCM
jgi:hypothetical protein